MRLPGRSCRPILFQWPQLGTERQGTDRKSVGVVPRHNPFTPSFRITSFAVLMIFAPVPLLTCFAIGEVLSVALDVEAMGSSR